MYIFFFKQEKMVSIILSTIMLSSCVIPYIRFPTWPRRSNKFHTHVAKSGPSNASSTPLALPFPLPIISSTPPCTLFSLASFLHSLPFSTLKLKSPLKSLVLYILFSVYIYIYILDTYIT